mgnify:CR=1 FL=1
MDIPAPLPPAQLQPPGGQPQSQPPQQGQPQGADQAMLGAYRRLSLAAMKIIYDPKVSQDLLNTMKEGGDPAAGVAHAAGLVVGQLRQQAKGINPAAVESVAPATVAMLFELGHAAGLFKPDQGMVQKAVQLYKEDAQMAKQQPSQQPQQAEQPMGGIIGGAMAPGVQ